eukprot:6716234-Ditylum_brightwellii.AAC.1
MEGIIDHAKDEATTVPMNDNSVEATGPTWVLLKDIKELHPIEFAEYAKARGITNDPAIMRWISYTPRKCDVILSAVNARIRKTTHKYGIETPTSL